MKIVVCIIQNYLGLIVPYKRKKKKKKKKAISDNDSCQWDNQINDTWFM